MEQRQHDDFEILQQMKSFRFGSNLLVFSAMFSPNSYLSKNGSVRVSTDAHVPKKKLNAKSFVIAFHEL